MSKTIISHLRREILLQAAAREDGHLYPLPTLCTDGTQLLRATNGLCQRKFATRVLTNEPAKAWQRKGEEGHGLVISDAGRAAVALTPLSSKQDDKIEDANSGGERSRPLQPEDEAQAAPAMPGNKTALLIGLLTREKGATLEQMVAATGWLPHTTRAALTRLKKKGHALDSSKAVGVRTYRISSAAQVGA